MRLPAKLFSSGVAALTAAAISSLGGARIMASESPESLELPAAQRGDLLAYVGTYTNGKSKGIYIYRFDPRTGKLTEAGAGPMVQNPSFLTVSPNRRYLYAVNEIGNFNGTNQGAVSAFSIDGKSGALTLLNQQPSGGSGPCFVSLDRSGQSALVANYGSGSVAVLPVDEDGKLRAPTCQIQHRGTGPNPRRQEGPHAHSIRLDPDNRFAYAADLGLDQVMIYRFDAAKHTLGETPAHAAKTAPGAGPRHTAFHPNGKFLFVDGEMASTLTSYLVDPDTGALTEIQTLSTLPAGWQGDNTTAEVACAPDGRHVYVSNRGHDSIAVFSVDPSTGRMNFTGTESTQGKTPRNFALDPAGRFLLAANQDSDSLVVFHVDPQTGKLQPTGQSIQVPAPVCIKL